jgi:hypothetical protein
MKRVCVRGLAHARHLPTSWPLRWRGTRAALVTKRWSEYFPAGNIAMGDSERAHLD